MVSDEKLFKEWYMAWKRLGSPGRILRSRYRNLMCWEYQNEKIYFPSDFWGL